MVGCGGCCSLVFLVFIFCSFWKWSFFILFFFWKILLVIDGIILVFYFLYIEEMILYFV